MEVDGLSPHPSLKLYKLLLLYPTFLREVPASHPEQVIPFACLSFPGQGLDVILSTAEGEGAEQGAGRGGGCDGGEAAAGISPL